MTTFLWQDRGAKQLLSGLHRTVAPQAQLPVRLPSAQNLPLLQDALHGR